MRLRRERKLDFDEQLEVNSLRALLDEEESTESSRPDGTYWANQRVRINQRIDDVTSGKALSLSWAARVALPGVVAIIFFFIGLHYYLPEQPKPKTSSLTAIVFSLPDNDLDSLFADLLASEPSSTPAEAQETIFSVTNDQIADYWIDNGQSTTLLENLGEQQIDELLTAIQSKESTL